MSLTHVKIALAYEQVKELERTRTTSSRHRALELSELLTQAIELMI